MKIAAFALRNTKEIIRDPLTVAFGLGFPVVLLLLLSMIQANIPVQLFGLSELTPGVCTFGFSFLALFAGILISKDRTGSLMLRLLTSPLKARDYIIGYTLPLLPVAVLQMAVCFAVAVILGLEFSVNILLCLLVSLPSAVLFIGLGLLSGTVLNDKQVGGICGAMLTNVSAWLSDTWFDVEMVGGAFERIAKALPFIHAVNAGRAALAGDYAAIFPDLWWVIGYGAAVLLLAIFVFIRRMNRGAV